MKRGRQRTISVYTRCSHETCMCMCVCVYVWYAGITRVLFTKPDIDARLVVMAEMDKLNLDVRYVNENVNIYI